MNEERVLFFFSHAELKIITIIILCGHLSPLSTCYCFFPLFFRVPIIVIGHLLKLSTGLQTTFCRNN